MIMRDYEKMWKTLENLVEKDRANHKIMGIFIQNRQSGLKDVLSMMTAISNAEYEVSSKRKREQDPQNGQPGTLTEDVLHALSDDMTMLDGAGTDNNDQPLIKLADAIKAINARIKEIRREP